MRSQALEKYLPGITLAMSLPLFFGFQLHKPPELLEGLPFVVLFTWAMLAVPILPILALCEI